MTDPTTYYADRLALYGLNPESKINWFRWEDADNAGFPQNCKYFSEHEEGIEIATPNVYGSRPMHIFRRKPLYITRLRVANPTRDEDTGQLSKYRFTHKWSKESAQDVKDAWLFIPPTVYDAVMQKQKLRTLYVTEGEFKSFIPAMWGLPIVGIPGIHNFRETSKGEMLDGIRHIIGTCKVENVVIVYDNDLIDLSTQVGKNNKPVDSRPRSFMGSASHFRKLLLQEQVNVFLAHPHPGEKKVGLDDLFTITTTETRPEFETRCRGIVDQLQECIGKAETGQRVDCETFMAYDITEFKAWDKEKGSSYKVLPRIFKLEHVNSFWEYHKTRQLKGFTSFRYDRLLYDIEEGVPVIHDDNSKFNNPLYEIGNAYFIDGNGENSQPRHLSDFRLKLQYVIFVDADDTRRIATITNTSNETKFVELRKQDIVSMQAFMLRLRSWPRFNWYGSQRELNLLISHLDYDRDVVFARMITKLGWQERARIYAFANGILDDAGDFHQVNNLGLVSKEGQGWLIPTESEIESLSEQGHNDKFFRFHTPENRITLTEWVARMRELHDTSRDPNGIVSAMWSIMCVYSDLVYDIAKFVPLLYLAGIPESGKSSCGRGVKAMYGASQPPMSIHSISATAFNRVSSHFVNACIWIDEWKNDVPKWKQEVIKNAYDRSGKTIGTFSADDQVTRVQYNSPILVSGQDIPGHGASDPALANRGVLCQFRVRGRDQAAMDRLKEWEDQHQNAGFTYLLQQLIQLRGMMEKHIYEQYTAIVQELNKELGNKASSARLVQNYAAMMAPAMVLSEAGHLQLGSTRGKVMRLMADKIKEQAELSESGSEISVFWRILEELFTMHDPEGRDGVRDRFELKIYPTEIYLRLNKLYDRYQRYAQRNNRPALDEGTLKQYLINHPAYVGTKRSVYYDNGYGTALVFNREHLPEAVNIMTEAEILILKNKAAGSDTGAPPVLNVPAGEGVPF